MSHLYDVFDVSDKDRALYFPAHVSPLRQGGCLLDRMTREHAVPGDHTVYRLEDELRTLYVGCTDDLWRRLWEHRRRASWWSLADSVAWVTFPTRDQALDYEWFVITEEYPHLNIQHNPLRDRARGLRAAMP